MRHFFSLGMLTLNQSLDREASDSVWVKVKVSDGVHTAQWNKKIKVKISQDITFTITSFLAFTNAENITG